MSKASEKAAAILASKIAKEAAAVKELARINAHPIATVVEPLRAASIERAKQAAQGQIDRVLDALAKADWLINVYAPYPSYGTYSSKADYRQKMALRSFVMMITDNVPGQDRLLRHDSKAIKVAPSAKGHEIVLKQAAMQASADYDAFIAKMVNKIGGCVSATLIGEHVWGFSQITATLDDGSVEKWKTQMICNYSVYGKAFNQWPSRKVK